MASMNLFFSPVVVTTTRGRRVNTAIPATAAKGSSGSSEEKGLWDFVLGALNKEEQMFETDPILKKVEEKSSGTTSRKASPVTAPPKKNGNGGFGGLFAKKG